MLQKIFFIALVFLLSCVNPTKKIDNYISQFKKQYPNQISTYQSPHRTMNYAWSGDPTKRPILFVHGSPGSWDGWSEFLLNEDLQKNYHLIAIDRPGYGKDNFGQTEISLQKQSEDIIAALKTNRSGLSAILIGHSFGGPVIAKAAMDYPKQVAGLVFVASSVDPNLEEIKWIQYPASWWPFKYLIPTALRVCNEEIFPLKNELITILPDWKNITAPTVIVHGEKDPLVPIENVDFIKKYLNEKLVIMTFREPELNHFVPWLRPDLILKSIQILNAQII